MPRMTDGTFYDLNPPAQIQGEFFRHVQCEYQVPNRPDEFVVKGIPEGGTTLKSFVLSFTKTGRVVPTHSASQTFLRLAGT